MNWFKQVFKHKKSRAFAIATLSTAAVLIALNVVATNAQFESVISIVLGGKRAITDASGEKNYEADVSSKAEGFQKANETSVEICKEGTVLLKNEQNALPLAKGAKISVFGKNANDIVRGGSGSSAGNTDQAKSLYDSLEGAGFNLNPTLKDFYADNSRSGNGRTDNPAIENGASEVSLETGETPQSSYTSDIKNSYASYNDAALIVISRLCGEGFDLPRHMPYDNNAHYLELDNNEKDLLSAVCGAGFKHIILLINSASPLELGFLTDTSDPAYHKEIDGALYIGTGGGQGIMALGSILNGETNPSGRTVDTYTKDFTKDPTYMNFGNNGEEDGDRYTYNGKKQLRYFVDYEEGIYLGYRYYETRGKNEGESWYNNQVVYPFGYGLSYTTFSWDVKTVASSLEADKKQTVEVEVTNTGSKAGKDVVELYVSLPYTAGGIEKSYKNLISFAKTSLLEPGAKETVTLEIDPYSFASYDSEDKNNNSFKGYELEKGEYKFFVAKNAHDEEKNFTQILANDYRFENDPTTGYKVENRFEDADDHLGSLLSRNDFSSTFPIGPTDEDRMLDEATYNALRATTSGNPAEDDADVEMPKQNVWSDIYLSEMHGLDYDDEKWETLLDELTAEEMFNMFTPSAFHTNEIEKIGKAKTNESDGTLGFTNFMNDPVYYGGCWYPCESITAGTWNVELAEKMGIAMGNEGLMGNEKGDGLPYSGIYAPGANLHRSPFGGRNAEYYSEDPLLSGKMAANVIKGARSKGLYCFIKHFALNEQETNRADNGDSSWVNEQAMRELYLKGFEIAIKEGESLGVMSSFNRIGTKWAGGHYELLTNVLRNEWGFKGAVISDFNTNSYMNVKQMIYAGGDIDLASQPHEGKIDLSKANDVIALRRATKNTLYVVANSSSTNIKVLGYKLPLWEELLFIADGVIAAGFVTWGFFAIRSCIKDAKKEEAETSN